MTSDQRRFRSHVRPRKKTGGWKTYYFFDMRGTGKPDIPLGADLDLALKKWAKLDIKIPRKVPTRRPGHPDAAYLALPAWAKDLYGRAKRRSKTVKRSFTLTKNEFAEIVARDRKCAVSGLAFEFDGRWNPFRPSLDRIDSKDWYTRQNIRLVTLAANMAMNSWGDSPLSALAAAMAEGRSASISASLLDNSRINAEATDAK